MVKSFARFTPYRRGRIAGKAEEGASLGKIRKEVLKKDGRRASLRAISKVLKRALQLYLHRPSLTKKSQAGFLSTALTVWSPQMLAFLVVAVVAAVAAGGFCVVAVAAAE